MGLHFLLDTLANLLSILLLLHLHLQVPLYQLLLAPQLPLVVRNQLRGLFRPKVWLGVLLLTVLEFTSNFILCFNLVLYVVLVYSMVYFHAVRLQLIFLNLVVDLFVKCFLFFLSDPS